MLYGALLRDRKTSAKRLSLAFGSITTDTTVSVLFCCPFVQVAIKPPTAMKSGTTICGIQLKDVVILAADTRSTSGPMVADKSPAFFADFVVAGCCWHVQNQTQRPLDPVGNINTK